MKLLSPNMGEALDRLTILERKIVEGQAQGKPIQEFQRETTALYAHLHEMGAVIGFLPLYLQLAAVNAAIWDATSEMAAAIAVQDRIKMATLGERIFNWNNERAAVVRKLDQDSGGVDPEKLYALPILS